MVGEDVVLHDLVELIIGDAVLGAEIGVGRGVADEDVDLAEAGDGGVDEVLQAGLVGDVGGDDDGGGAAHGGVDFGGGGFAGIGLATADDHIGAVFGHAVGDRLADAARGAGDEGGLAGEVE